PVDNCWTPYLGPGLDSGMAALFAFDMEEALKYLGDDCPYLACKEDPEETDADIWLGASDDVILRKRGVEFVDGSAPGFAAVVGAASTPEVAAGIAKELQEKGIYVFMASNNENGTSFAKQVVEAGTQVGWNNRLVPFGFDHSSAIHAIGFAVRAALTFGGQAPGDHVGVLKYVKDRIFAFILALGPVCDEQYAAACGCINFGVPTIANTDFPQVLPTGVCTYEHVVTNIPEAEIVTKGIEVRGLKITIAKIDIPMSYGPAFEGERIKKDAMHVELGGPKSFGFEFAYSKPLDQVEDGKFTVIGPNIKDVEEGGLLPIGIWIELAGRKFQEDFEPILERQCHHLLNGAEGILHIGQRDIVWMRISKKAVEAGFTFEHFGTILHAKMHNEFGAIVDKVQVTIFTDGDKVKEHLEVCRKTWTERDNRLSDMNDETTETFYSCSLCQSFAPTHVCVVTPERPGLCGAYNWLDCRASYEINEFGPNQPIAKGDSMDERLGKWKGVDEFVIPASGNAFESFAAYSILVDPMTSCGCFEAIAACLFAANGIMVVDRDYSGETPCGMGFSTLAGSVGGGLQTPGFVGISKFYVGSKKFISAEGGIKRLCWLPKALKEASKEMIDARGKEIGIPNFYDMIATEENGTDEETIMAFLTEAGHPCLEMEQLMEMM
ncbi:MAG: CO dehydrogenase/CO-methylating acetyl-CoA synthase complex subunit beta, partial [Deltaproteobacteria bacterium]|nr:CO dehydrogenase/CO-methylating acetyl-CoA synthase complex subunit beta [Candidatus Tharpella aukensis]